jgi:hypothetical protein
MSSLKLPPFTWGKMSLKGNTNPVKHGEEVETFLKSTSPHVGQEIKSKTAKCLPPTTSAPGPVPLRSSFPQTAAGQALYDTAVIKHDTCITAFNSSSRFSSDKEAAYALATAALVETMTPSFFDQLKAQSSVAKQAWNNNDPLTLHTEMYRFLSDDASGGSKYTKLFKCVREFAKLLGRLDASDLIDSSADTTEVIRKFLEAARAFETPADRDALAAEALIQTLDPNMYGDFKIKHQLESQSGGVYHGPATIQEVVTKATLSLGIKNEPKKKHDRSKIPPHANPVVNGGRGLAPTGNLPQKQLCTNCGKTGHLAPDCWHLHPETVRRARFEESGGGGRGGRGDQQQGRGRGGGRGGRGGRGGGAAGGGQHAAGRNLKRQGGGPSADHKKKSKWQGGIRLDHSEPFEASTIDDDFNKFTGTIARSGSGRREEVDAMEMHQSEAPFTKCGASTRCTDAPTDKMAPTNSNADPKIKQLHHRHVEERHHQVPPVCKFKTLIHYGMILCFALATLTFAVMCSVDLTEVEEACTMVDYKQSHEHPQVLVSDLLCDYGTAPEDDTLAVGLNETQELLFQTHFWGDLVPYDHGDTYTSPWNYVTAPLQILIAGIMTVVVVCKLIVSFRTSSERPPELIKLETHVVLLPRAQSATKGKASKISHDTGTQVTVIVPGDPYAGATRQKPLAVQGVGGKKQYSKEVFHELLQVWGALAEPGELPASLISTAALEHLHDYDGAFVEPWLDQDGNQRTRMTHQIWSNRSRSGPDLVFERVRKGEDSDLLIYNPELTVEGL